MKYRWLIFFALLGSLFLYTLHQALRFSPVHPVLAFLGTVALFILMFSWQFLARAGIGRSDSMAFRAYAWAGSFALGIWATFIVFWVPFDSAWALYALGRSLIRLRQSGWSFEAPLAGWLPGLVFILAAGLAGLGLEEVLTGPQVKEIEIPLSHLPAEWRDLRIAVISDIHIGPMVRRRYVEEIVKKVQEQKPDLIAVTGDLADGTVDILASQVEPLAGLKAPLGVFFVTGNHEYYWGPKEWIQKARDLGFIPLINENRIVQAESGKVMVAGITDLTAHHFLPEHLADPKKAATSDEKADVKILLSHRPSVANAAESLGFDLQISGHTHGGQFFPFTLFIPFFYRYSRGRYKHGKLWVYVNPGTGYWGPPHRFLVPAEITLLTVTAAR